MRAAADDLDALLVVVAQRRAAREEVGDEPLLTFGARQCRAGVDERFLQRRLRRAAGVLVHLQFARAGAAETDALARVAELRPPREADGLRYERPLVVQTDLRAAHGERAAGAGDRWLVLAPRRLDVVARAAVAHAEIRFDLPVLVDGLEHLHRAEAVQRNRLIGRNLELHRAARTGAELGILVEDHPDGRLLPWLILCRADLHDAFDARHRRLQSLDGRRSRGRGSGGLG